MKKMNKGFTLIELMIVVAIIGILAAVAIPGFMRYIKDSKTAEAKDNLKGISDGALAYFQAEHVYDDAMKPEARLYPGDSELNNAAAYVPSAGSDIGDNTDIGKKNDPNDYEAALATAPWNHLKFQITKPFYYKYTYSSEGASGANASTFGASAEASLNEAEDSGFIINGDANGVLTPTVECAEGQAADSAGGAASCS